MSVPRCIVLISSATVHSGSLLTHHAEVEGYATIRHRNTPHSTFAPGSRYSSHTILQCLSSPCSHRCYKHNNPQMSVSHIMLNPHAHSTGFTAAQVITWEGPWSSSSVHLENFRSRERARSATRTEELCSLSTRCTHSMRQAPCYILAASETFQLSLILTNSSLKENKSHVRLP